MAWSEFLQEAQEWVGLVMIGSALIGLLGIAAALAVEQIENWAKRRHETEYRKWLEEARLGGGRWT